MAESKEVTEPGDNRRRLSLFLCLPLCSFLITGCSAREEQQTGPGQDVQP